MSIFLLYYVLDNPLKKELDNFQFCRKGKMMLRLRPYHIKDAETILSWAKDEKAFYKWTAGVLGTYPLSLEQFHSVSDLMVFYSDR